MGVNHYERAAQIWDVLVKAASNKKNKTYKEISEDTKIHWRAQYIPLGFIQDYCIENDLPPLSILAVNNSTGLPGTGFIACSPDKIKTELENVYQFNWKEHTNPFYFAKNVKNIEQIIEAIRNFNFNNENVQKIKSRGILQSLLKDAMMKFYNNQCAMCSLSIEELLEACHIKPFSDCSDEEKKDPRNIIILCKNHHKLFDSGLITIDENYKMHVDSSVKLKTASDLNLFQHIENETITLPSDIKFYPEKKYLNYLNKK